MSHPDYEVSDLGRVRRLTGGKGVRAGRVLSPCVQNRGYLTVQVYRAGTPTRRTVHSLVAEAFIGPRAPGAEVNHKDGVKTHNALSNLEYVTASGNKRHAVNTGIGAVGRRNAATRLSEEDVLAIRAACMAGESQRSVARRFGVSQPHVSDIVSGRRRQLVA